LKTTKTTKKRPRRAGRGTRTPAAKKAAAAPRKKQPAAASAAAAPRKRQPAAARPPAALVPTAPTTPAPLPRDIPLTVPEATFAARVPPEPERAAPTGRRAIFFDVENTSRAEHLARVIDHLAVDRLGRRVEFVAVGNWKVVGHDTARLLARHGAQLVHSAPSVGVRDWSDLRIAVAAGVWLATARPGDIIEIISDDRAFDAVGDVAASLGIEYRRLSYRQLMGVRDDRPVREPAAVAERAPAPRQGRRRRGRRYPPRDRAPVPVVTTPPPPAAPPVVEVPVDGATAEPHTAPHDEIISVARELIASSASGAITIDALANALKGRGFRRTSGSPRLITRLRRIRELTISRSGQIALVNGAERPTSGSTSAEPAPAHEEAVPEEPIAAESDDGPGPGNERVPSPSPEQQPRRSRRGGRRRRGRGRMPEGARPAPALP